MKREEKKRLRLLNAPREISEAPFAGACMRSDVAATHVGGMLSTFSLYVPFSCRAFRYELSVHPPCPFFFLFRRFPFLLYAKTSSQRCISADFASAIECRGLLEGNNSLFFSFFLCCVLLTFCNFVPRLRDNVPHESFLKPP